MKRWLLLLTNYYIYYANIFYMKTRSQSILLFKNTEYIALSQTLTLQNYNNNKDILVKSKLAFSSMKCGDTKSRIRKRLWIGQLHKGIGHKTLLVAEIL